MSGPMSDTAARTPAGFRLDIEHLDGSAVIRLTGALDAVAAPSFRDDVWPLLARYEAEMVTIVADDLGTIDGAGLAVLVGFARAMAPGHPAVRGLRPDLRATLEETGCFDLD